MGKFLISAVSITPFLCCSLSFGCASQSEKTRKELDLVNEKIAILQNERDRLEERLGALEQQQALATKPQPQGVLPGRPPLKVVTLEPDPPPPAAPDAAAGVSHAQGRVLISGTGTELKATAVEDDTKLTPAAEEQ